MRPGLGHGGGPAAAQPPGAARPAEAVLAALGAAVRAVTAESSLDRVLGQLA